MRRSAPAMLASLVLAGLAHAGEAPPQIDTSGKGAVLCGWSIYVGIEQGIRMCDLPPEPGDENIAPSIARVERFILENTTQGISRAVLDDYKRTAGAQSDAFMQDAEEAMCTNIARMRDLIVGDIVRMTDDLLSVPREPVWNPCL